MFPAPHHLSPSPLLIATGVSFLLLCVEGVTDLPSAHQDEACLTRKLDLLLDTPHGTSWNVPLSMKPADWILGQKASER